VCGGAASLRPFVPLPLLLSTVDDMNALVGAIPEHVGEHTSAAPPDVQQGYQRLLVLMIGHLRNVRTPPPPPPCGCVVDVHVVAVGSV